MSLKDYSIKRRKDTPEWPEENGKPVTPAFLEHVHGNRLDMDMELDLLHTYGIPALCEFPNNGKFAEIILGFAPTGTDIYVPETLLEDAKNIISFDMNESVNEELES